MHPMPLEETQSWITCYLTDILLSHIEETVKGKSIIDYPALFRGLDGFEVPADPESFLTDRGNWVPLSVLRELEAQCEKISGRKDFAYHAARAYFIPGKKPLPSVFEIIVQVLNDVRSALISANLWGASQSNYLKLQSFEKQGAARELYMLARFSDNARPAIGAIHLLRGFCEGFPRLYPFIEEVQCLEEISQLRIEDAVREFPDFSATIEGDSFVIRHRFSDQAVVRASRVALKSEVVPLSAEFIQSSADGAVVEPRDGRMEVLTPDPDADTRTPSSAFAYRITHPGLLSAGPLSFALEAGRIFNAPYCRFRIAVKERPLPQKDLPADVLRKEISQRLFDHLKQTKHAHMRMVQFNVDKRRLTQENLLLRREIEREYGFPGIIGQSQRMRELYRTVQSVAATDVAVIIQGETGTGKELIAKAIHHHSARRTKGFVAVNCGALTETLLESEIFGHEKGAFTGATNQRKGIFEVADGGTLFLDEIGEITPSTQVKLLRVLQEGEFQRVGARQPIKVDVRIIAATNQNLEELVKTGPFRADLYYRLNVFPIVVPPLRERMEDIPLLISHFLEKYTRSVNKTIRGISAEAMALLAVHHWPGNVRELENVVQRMMVMAKGERLDVEDLPHEISREEIESGERAKGLKGISKESSGLVEANAILDALSKTGRNITHAAKLLGVSRATLQNKMKAYGLRNVKE
jgi:two-component system response regulator HydG